MATSTSDTAARGRSGDTADLVRTLGEQMSRLVRDEMLLARAELTERGKAAGAAAGLFGAGGVLGLLAGGALTAAAVLGLATWLPAWASAAVVGAALLIAAGAAALAGRRKVARAAPPVPTQAIDSLRADLDAVRNVRKDRGSR